MRVRLTLEYDGTGFRGWAAQPGERTVENELRKALAEVFPRWESLAVAGRTDTGVHALAQVASFTTESPIPAENLTKALNDILPASIRVLEVTEAPAEFHARKSARAKTYRYRMLRSPICPPFLARYVWHYPYPLDENAMRRAASLVVGEHDFTSFAAVDPERGAQEEVSNIRRIFCSTWERDGEEFAYSVRGSGFLHHMVRNLVGTSVLVGKGTLSPDDIMRILEARNRSAAGATAPASGLYLVSVEY